MRLTGERETLGLYLTGHPIDRFESDLPRFVSARIGDLLSERPLGASEARGFNAGKPTSVAGLIDEVRKRGQRTSMVLDDRSGRLEVTLFDEIYQQYRDLIAKDALVLVEGMLRFDEFTDGWRLAARRITDLHKVREEQVRRIVLRWPSQANANTLLTRLAEVLAPWRGGACQISVQYTGGGASGAFNLAAEWAVRPGRELLEHLEGLVGRDGLTLLYGPPPGLGHGPSFGAGRR